MFRLLLKAYEEKRMKMLALVEKYDIQQCGLYLAELYDESTSLREVHAIRLAMEDERIESRLSRAEWSKKQGEWVAEMMTEYGLAHLLVDNNPKIG